MALGQLGSAAFFLQALQSIDLATAGLLLYSAPIWIVLFYLLTKEEEMGKKIILPLIFGISGLVLILGPKIGADIGLIWGVLSGVSYGLSYVYARKVHEEYKTVALVFWNHLIGLIILWPFLFIYPFELKAKTVGLFIGTGLSWFFGYILLYYSLKFVKAHHASIIGMLEPVFIAAKVRFL